MAEYTRRDLRKDREKRNMARWELAREVGVSESTVERWESGETKPTPDDIDRIGEALQDPTIWHRWMCSSCDSYRKRYQSTPDARALPLDILRLRHEMRDVMELQDAMERDALDGRLDNAELKARYAMEIRENMAAEIAVLQRIEPKGGGTHG